MKVMAAEMKENNKRKTANNKGKKNENEISKEWKLEENRHREEENIVK